MAAKMSEYRWVVEPHQFAVRFQVNDLPGLLAKTVIVEPGVRALIVDDGQYLGDIPEGTYTAESFWARLKFWKPKQCTVVLARREDQPLDLECDELATADHLMVQAKIRVAVQISDVALLLNNLMGARDEFTTTDLAGAVQPMLWQALWQATGRMTIQELSGPDVQGQIDALVDQNLNASLKRYGLSFSQVQAVAVRHPKYDEHRKLLGEVSLLQEKSVVQQEMEKLYDADELRKIQRLERTNDLELLAQNLQVDREEGETAVAIRRLGVQRELQAAIQSEKFQKIKDATELAEMVLQADQAKVLRDHELAEYQATFEAHREDREAARAHLLRKLEAEQAAELGELQADLQHRVKTKTLQHEIELARVAESEQSRRWREMLQRRSEEAAHQREETRKQAEHDRRQAQAASQDGRDEDYQGILHQQRMSRVEREILWDQAEQSQRVAQLEDELQWRRQEQQAAFDKAKAESDLAMRAATQKNNIERLKELQEANRANALFEAELRERAAKAETDLALMRDNASSQRELDRIRAMRGMTTEELLSLTNTDNAAILAQVKMHEASQNSETAAQQRELELRREQIARESEAAARQQEQQRQAAEARAQDAKDNLSTLKDIFLNMAGRPAQPAPPAPQTPPPATPCAHPHSQPDSGAHRPRDLFPMPDGERGRQPVLFPMRQPTLNVPRPMTVNSNDAQPDPGGADPPGSPSEERLVSTRELMDFLQLSRTKIWELVKHEGLPAFKIGGDYRYLRSEVLAWLEKYRIRSEKGGESPS